MRVTTGGAEIGVTRARVKADYARREQKLLCGRGRNLNIKTICMQIASLIVFSKNKSKKQLT
jgi:hypothetical protein